MNFQLSKDAIKPTHTCLFSKVFYLSFRSILFLLYPNFFFFCFSLFYRRNALYHMSRRFATSAHMQHSLPTAVCGLSVIFSIFSCVWSSGKFSSVFDLCVFCSTRICSPRSSISVLSSKQIMRAMHTNLFQWLHS